MSAGPKDPVRIISITYDTDRQQIVGLGEDSCLYFYSIFRDWSSYDPT